ncbi:MAG: TadE/TadG family type IV pilus assembly protein, partial [Novosphingobium sp.]
MISKGRARLSHRIAARFGSLSRIGQDEAGVSAVEFTLVAPVFLSLVIGIFDLGQMAYGISVTNGAVEKAARDSALESA